MQEISVGTRRANTTPTEGTQLAEIDLAEETRVHENYVSDLQLGRKEICLRTLQVTAAAFSVKTAELLQDPD
jgi:hypothetical protein